jgi:hypothetical protein
MKTAKEIGMKIAAAQREYFRYTGVSAELDCQGAGSFRPGLAWAARQKKVAAGQNRVKSSQEQAAEQ